MQLPPLNRQTALTVCDSRRRALKENKTNQSIFFNDDLFNSGEDELRFSLRLCACLRQATRHCKSVYSAQFGIKHNRPLSAGCCLRCPIKNGIYCCLKSKPETHISRSPSETHFFLPWRCWCRSPPAAAVRQVIGMAHYRPKQRHDVAGVPTYLSAHHRSCASYTSSCQSTQNKRKIEPVYCPATPG